MADTCFVCATPYQIMAAISIVYNSEKTADLFVLPDFLKAEEYAQRIRGLSIFSKVVLVDTARFEAHKRSRNRNVFRIGRTYNYLRINYIVKSIVGDSFYKEIYISTRHNIGDLISIYFIKRGSEVIFYDDGEGSYFWPDIYEASGMDKVIRTILFGKRAVGLSDKRMLYCPELFINAFGNSYNVSSIPNWSQDESLLSIINYVCGYNEKLRINHKYVILDTIPSEGLNSDEQIIYENLLDKCINKFGKDLIIKKHPRDKREPKSNCEYYQFPDIPFEVICANSDVGNKVLICSSSTAVLTPKLLFDLEPRVIFLYHITGGVTNNSKRDDFISGIKALYHNKDRIMIPNTEEEFENVLSSFD